MSIISKTIVASIVKSFQKEVEAVEGFVKNQDKEIQKALDLMWVTCTTDKPTFMKGNAKTNEARGEVKALFELLASKEYISGATAKTYQSCFWIAFEKGIPFDRRLHVKQTDTNNATAKVDTVKAGAVSTTTMEDMHKTLSKALAQGRMLNQLVFVPALLDFIVEHYPEFKETVLGK
jgi:hypothetical protein